MVPERRRGPCFGCYYRGAQQTQALLTGLKIDFMEYKSEFLVIGSGVAGLLLSLKVADYGRVYVVTKRNLSDSNTAYAQGGIASVFCENDSFDLHIADTLASGDGICHEGV